MKIATAYIEIIGKDTKLRVAIRRARLSLENFAQRTQRLSRVSRRALMGLVGGLAAVGYAAGKFEKQMNMVSTMLDEDTMPMMDKFATGIRSMSVEFGEGTATLSKGLYDILSASIPASQAMKVLRTSVIAAKGGMTDTAVSADALTTILNAYNMTAVQAGKVSDVLFGIVKGGKTTMQEVGQSIGMVAGTAGAAGLSLEEMAASLATQALTQKTARAVTALNAILMVFQKKAAPESIEMAREFGFELSTATLRTEGLTGVMKKLSKATASQRALIFKDAEALRGVNALLQKSEAHTKNLKLMQDSAGLSMEAFRRAAKGLFFQFGRLEQAAIRLAEAIGDVVFGRGGAGGLSWLVDKVKALTKFLRELSPKQQAIIGQVLKWSVALLALGAAITPILWALGGLLGVLHFLVGPGGAILLFIGAMATLVDWLVTGKNHLADWIGSIKILGHTIKDWLVGTLLELQLMWLDVKADMQAGIAALIYGFEVLIATIKRAIDKAHESSVKLSLGLGKRIAKAVGIPTENFPGAGYFGATGGAERYGKSMESAWAKLKDRMVSIEKKYKKESDIIRDAIRTHWDKVIEEEKAGLDELAKKAGEVRAALAAAMPTAEVSGQRGKGEKRGTLADPYGMYRRMFATPGIRGVVGPARDPQLKAVEATAQNTGSMKDTLERIERNLPGSTGAIVPG